MFRATTVLFIAAAAVLALLNVVNAASLERRSNSGTATYYSVKNSGKPSCGGDYDNDDMVCALSHKRMPKGHGKPCGEKINIKHNGKSIKVKVIDTCDSCDKDDVDLSHAAFKELGDMDKGELKITWSFD